tara:strand:+ start:12873 stop:13796 length:924 start_codon:yes stop_codon:yes gene_type:complete
MSEGHWRKLPPTWKGTDKDGLTVYGKTWVDRKDAKKEKRAPVEEEKAPVEEEKAPVEEVPKEAPKKALKESEKDKLAWDKWKASGSEEDLEALMDRFQRTVTKTVYKFKSAAVPLSVIEAAANIQLMKALDTWEYKEGKANLNTWVTIYLRKVGAVVGKYQNLGKIPEHRRTQIGVYKRMKAELVEKLGYEPDAKTMVQNLGPKWSLKEVARMESELARRDLIASQSVESDTLSEIEQSASEERQIFRYVYHELHDEKERLVFEYTAGFNGKPELSAGEIAKKLKLHPSKVSRIRKKIDGLFRERGM